MTLNLLSILLSIALMLSGGAGLEADVPAANVLTVSNIYFDYNDNSFALTPSVTAGVMTENGNAVFDLSMQCGEASLFPMQLVLTEEAATLVVEKTGQAFTIDAETLNALAAEALDIDFEELAADEEFNQAMEILNGSYGTAFNMGSAEVDTEAINAKVQEMLTPVETGVGTAYYDDVEYQVDTKHYVLDNDQMFEMIEMVYASSEELSATYEKLLATINETLAMEAEEGAEVPEITSMKELYAMLGMTMTLDLTENTTEDGAFSQAVGTITLNYAELPEPVVISIDAVELNGVTDVLCESIYAIEDMELAVGFASYGNGEGEYFEMITEIMPVDTGDLTDEDYADAFSFYITGSTMPSEDGGSEYGLTAEVSTYNAGAAFLVSGAEDAEGNNTVNVDFEYADDTDTIACGLKLDLTHAAFANAAEGLSTIAVDPENMEPLEAQFTTTVMSLMTDLQTLIEDESVTEIIAAFTAINTAGYETVDEVTSVDIPMADENSESVTETDPENNVSDFNAPEITYIPEGMSLEDVEIDAEYYSASYTIADEDYDNAYYIYVYADPYAGEFADYILGDDGSMTVSEDRTVRITVEEDAIYADAQDGNVSFGLSYYGTDYGIEEIGKILAGMTH